MKIHQFATLLICLSFALLPLACSSYSDEDANEAASEATAGYDVAGFKTFVVDGRLWVFEEGSEALAEYESVGEPAKSVTRIGEGPEGMTIRSDSYETIDAYMTALN